MDKQEILKILQSEETHSLFSTADKIRKEECGDDIFVRGIIEFSSYCIRNCLYCGLRKDNTVLDRFRMEEKDILKTADEIAGQGIRTVVLQSGDDFFYTEEALCRIISAIKEKHPHTAVTLCIGERTRSELKAFKTCGADRYLIKFETADCGLYQRHHPGQDFKKRIDTAFYLRELGYQVGVGNIVGLPGQTAEHLSDDIFFMQSFQPEMAGIGPFIPQKDTLLGDQPSGDLQMTLKVLALTRLVCPHTHLPATTALASIDKLDGQVFALKAGANVIMLNFTPPQQREHYKIYDHKVKIDLELAEKTAFRAGRKLCLERGDALKITGSKI